jgi:hypothetical protein
MKRSRQRLPPARADNYSGARLIELVSRVGPPSALAAALLFYFGWVRAQAQAQALGYDVSVVGLTNTDYVLRSVPALFLPLLALAFLFLALLSIDRRLLHALRGRRRRAAPLSRILRLAPALAIALAIVAALVSPGGGYVAVPLTLTIGVLAYLYAGRIEASTSTKREQSQVQRLIVVVILVMLLFWDVERIARLYGEGYAELAVSRPDQYASIVLFSSHDLELDHPGVLVQRIGADESAFRFRYEGLRLLNYANSRYFLLSGTDGADQPVIVVVPDLPTIRVEFPGGS